ncbi:uncharacterized protein UTRI_04082_B [Ustilago trichophora]|uniref:Secreted protein n=1 Tax=Ustilago trichophora TaxID=86804 RepID=A0A5C3E7R0_9BASI|nr:uncharacterized protein UTRI_04082_B [Ustilago trichophora]
MLHTKMNLVGLATVLVSSALVAASYSSTDPAPPAIDSAILVPCGPAGEKEHAVVPDANGCQLISSTGAFSVNQLPILQPGVRIGFAADPSCSKTYLPTYEELLGFKNSQLCSVYILDQSDPAGATVHNDLQGGHGKRSTIGGKPVSADTPPHGAEDDKWNNVFTKRDNNPAAPADQVTLKYVMLVTA